jgi:hypothetical protein
MPCKTCHDVSGDKNIIGNWQMTRVNRVWNPEQNDNRPTRTLIGKGYEPAADEKEATQTLRTRRTKTRWKTLEGRPAVLWDPKKAGCGI